MRQRRANAIIVCCRCTGNLFVEANPIPVKWAMAADGPHRKRAAAAARAVIVAASRFSPHRPARCGMYRMIVQGVRHASTLRFISANNRSRWCVLVALAGCESMTASLGKKIEYKSTGTAPALEVPPDLTTPQYDDRYNLATASGCGGACGDATPRRQRHRAQRNARGARRACRYGALAGCESDAATGVECHTPVLAGHGLRALGRAARSGRDGNGLGGESRRSAAGHPAQIAGRRRRLFCSQPTSATSSARGSSAGPSRERSRSTFRIAASSRCRR